jgi:type I restriction enzyme M protein
MSEPGPQLEAALWAAADALRSGLDAAAYKHVLLGLVFLRHTDEAAARGSLAVPAHASWRALAAGAARPSLAARIDEAMAAIEHANPALRGVLPRGYAAAGLEERTLARLIELLDPVAPGDGGALWRDALGRVYECFLGRFARAEGRNGGQYYTPRCVVRLLVELLAPRAGRLYDPCCGSGGMFVQTAAFAGGASVELHGQESNLTTWRLSRMNLALHGLGGDLGPRHADSLHDDLHPGLLADFVLANPPFNDRGWRGELLRDDPRWVHGVPPPRNANFAWLQHILHHLAPGGRAAVVLANGSLSSTQAGEREIRRSMLEAGAVECVISLPPQLFHATTIPACVWVLRRGAAEAGATRSTPATPATPPQRTLFIDARGLGALQDRTHRALSEAETARIAAAYRGFVSDGKHPDAPGFCRAAGPDEIAEHGHVLSPGRYVGAARAGGDPGTKAGGLRELARELEAQLSEGARLDDKLRHRLETLLDAG